MKNDIANNSAEPHNKVNPHSNNYNAMSNVSQKIVSNMQITSLQQDIKIYIDKRVFSLSLDNFNENSKNKIIDLFYQRHYTLEELLAIFIKMLKDQSLAEQELLNIVKILTP